MISVLVIDDDFMVAEIHASFVNQTPGFRVIGTAHSGAAALDAAERLKPDLVLLDIYLPDMRGTDVLYELRVSKWNMDVLVITAARDAETVQKALHGGVLSYLLKPFDQKVLTARLHEYRERRVAGISEQVDQSELDSVFGASAAEQVPEKRPKGITSETVALVIGSLSTAPEGTSAAECAAACGLSRVSARRYLEYLADVGRVSVSLRYATAGRPERRYVLKQAVE